MLMFCQRGTTSKFKVAKKHYAHIMFMFPLQSLLCCAYDQLYTGNYFRVLNYLQEYTQEAWSIKASMEWVPDGSRFTTAAIAFRVILAGSGLNAVPVKSK